MSTSTRRRRVLVLLLGCSLSVLSACAARGPIGSDPAEVDAWITREVLRVLAEEDEVVIEDLRVETGDGVVVLFGVQPSTEAVAAALNRAARVRGVRQVINQIRVVQGLPTGRA